MTRTFNVVEHPEYGGLGLAPAWMPEHQSDPLQGMGAAHDVLEHGPRDRVEWQGNARAFVGPEAVNVFAMAALSTGLRMFAESGLRPNRAWTPTAMMRAARVHLGPEAPKLRAHDYIRAADLLAEKVQAEKARLG